MPSRLFNLARMTVASAPGLATTIALGAAIPGFLTFDLAGVLNGQVVRYGAKDGNAREMGYGTYNFAAKQITGRFVQKSTNGDAALNLSAQAIVSILPAAEDFATIAPQSGKLLFASTTALRFDVFNGNKLKINGKLYEIPSTSAGGLPGLGNTNVIVNGVAGQNLIASTIYQVVGLVSNGQAVGGYSAYPAHARSAVVDNEGVEISSQYGDAMSVIGMVRTASNATFYDPWTLSWFNRRFKETHQSMGNASTTSATHVDMIGGVVTLSWADERLWLAWSTQGSTNDAGGYCSIDIGIDSVDVGLMQIVYYNATTPLPINLAGWYAAAEGTHVLSGRGSADRNNGSTLNCFNSVLGWGTNG